MQTSFRIFPALATAIALGAALQATAQNTVKADNVTALNATGSWVGGAVPTAADTIVIDNTLTASRTSPLGGNLTVNGIVHSATPITSPAAAARQFQISATTGATLTLGAAGITKDANTTPLIIASALTLGANQTWNVAASTGTNTGNLQINGAFSDGGHQVTINGAGILDLRASNTFGSNVTINTNVSVNSAAAVVTFGGSNGFDSLAVPSGKVIGATLGNFGEASSFGDGGTNTAISLGSTNAAATLEYTGATATSNRTFNMDRRSNGATLLVSNPAATLTITGTIQTSVGNATGEKDVILTVGGDGNLALKGVITDHSGTTATTGITKNGAGVLTLGAANTYQGVTTINAGTLQVGDGATSGQLGSGNVVNAGTLAFNRSNSLTVANAISGTGAVRMEGTGTLTLSGTNTYSGATSIDAGTVIFAQTAARSANTTVTAAAGTTVGLGLGGAGSYTSADVAALFTNTLGGFSLSSGTKVGVDTTAGSATVGDTLTGARGLVKFGDNTLTLTGANTYAGGTTIAAGTLQVGDGGTSGQLGAGAITNESALVFNRSDALAFATGITGAGSLAMSGTGTLTLQTALGYTGDTIINAGTLALGAANLLHDSSDLVLAGGTFATHNLSETVATLSLLSSSVIDLGIGGDGSILFGDSAAATWTPGAVLTINGTFVPGQSLRFGQDANGLTSTQLSSIVIAGWEGLALTETGFLTAVPEPSTYALGFGMAALGLVVLRRRRQLRRD